MSSYLRSCTAGALVTLASVGASFAQTDDLMLREIDEALAPTQWRLGAFRLTPALRLGGGFDSNAYSSPEFPVEDVTFVLGPGLRAVVPMGNRGLVDVYQEVSYVYFQDQTQLRDVRNFTRIGGALGGRDFVLRGKGELEQGKVRPSSELDVPLEREARRIRGEADVAIGERQELTLAYERARFLHEEPAGRVVEESLANRLDRDEQGAQLGLRRHLTGTTALLVAGIFEEIDYFNDSTERDGRGHGLECGVEFSPNGDVRGEALLGYKRLVPSVSTQAAYGGLTGSVDVIARLGSLFRVRGIFFRNTRPSILDGNWFFVENRLGGSIDIYLTERFYVRSGAIVGRNTYPHPTRFTDAAGREVSANVEDGFQLYSFSFNYEVGPDFVARLGGDYQVRDSNFPAFNKGRFVLQVGLTTDF